jgi:hypothetical protein
MRLAKLPHLKEIFGHFQVSKATVTCSRTSVRTR